MVESSLRNSVTCADTTYEVWEALRGRFSVGNEPQIYELDDVVTACKQEGLSVQDYFGRLKLMWDDIAEYDPISACCCGRSNCAKQKEIFAKHERTRKS